MREQSQLLSLYTLQRLFKALCHVLSQKPHRSRSSAVGVSSSSGLALVRPPLPDPLLVGVGLGLAFRRAAGLSRARFAPSSLAFALRRSGLTRLRLALRLRLRVRARLRAGSAWVRAEDAGL